VSRLVKGDLFYYTVRVNFLFIFFCGLSFKRLTPLRVYTIEKSGDYNNNNNNNKHICKASLSRNFRGVDEAPDRQILCKYD